MKKYKIITVGSLLSLWLVACAHSKKVGYDFPPAMSVADRTKFTNICDKGQILYNISCAACHNVQLKHKSIIPDFTQDQMSRYELKANNMQHDSSQVFTRVRPEELSDIYLFLTYKKKSNVPLVLPPH